VLFRCRHHAVCGSDIFPGSLWQRPTPSAPASGAAFSGPVFRKPARALADEIEVNRGYFGQVFGYYGFDHCASTAVPSAPVPAPLFSRKPPAPIRMRWASAAWWKSTPRWTGFRFRAFQAVRLSRRQGGRADLRRRSVAGEYARSTQGARDECTKAGSSIGKHATYHPAILRQVAAAGHTVGAHTCRMRT